MPELPAHCRDGPSRLAAVLALVRIARAVRDAIVCYDEQIETLAREHPDFAIIDSLPGVGPALAPRRLNP